ncbi:MAG: hypothetical protein O3A51_08900 [Verrucomicrobia bacterium]|nr:hypothetical protein [Verrucomicrobiota bacterium]
MRHRQRALLALFVIWLAVITYMIYCQSRLASPIGAHFSPGGDADIWMGKNATCSLYLAVMIVLTVPALACQKLLKRIPWLLMSLPNRHHWLSPPHRHSSLNDVSTRLLWLCNGTLMLILGCLHLTFRANRLSPPFLDGHAPRFLLVAYALFLICWVALWFLRYGRPSPARDGSFTARRCSTEGQ